MGTVADYFILAGEAYCLWLLYMENLSYSADWFCIFYFQRFAKLDIFIFKLAFIFI